jgi:hypothetical protein
MERYKITTLVDITRSKATRTETDRLKIGQQANFNSLIQAIGIRANIEWDTDPKFLDGRLPDFIQGSGSYWIWEFYTERDSVFAKGNDSVFLLKEDLQGVPIINRLNNTVEIFPAIFQTKGTNQNIWIDKIS